MTDPNPSEHLNMLRKAADHLDHLRERMVFVGGAVVPLLITDPAAFEVRATEDVDLVVDVNSYVEYNVHLRQQLHDLGIFEELGEHVPICRWNADGLLLDLMPPIAGVLGFTSRWYRDVLTNFHSHPLPDGPTIKVIDPVYLLATKAEAFEDRGKRDIYASHDLEDIIALIDGRPEIVTEVLAARAEVRDALDVFIRDLLDHPHLQNVLAGQFAGDIGRTGRVPIVLERLKALTAKRK